jgi:hypothetical protein
MVSYNNFLYTTLAAFSPTALQETNTELFVSYSGLKYERMQHHTSFLLITTMVPHGSNI